MIKSIWTLTLAAACLAGPARGAYDVVVVGGGVAGLSAAWNLRDLDVLLLEKEPVVGGRIAGGEYRGWHYAMGTEYLGEPEPALAKLIKASKAKWVEIPSPMDASFHNGKFYWGEDGFALKLIRGSSLKQYNQFGKLLDRLSKQCEYLPEPNPTREVARLDTLAASAWFDELGLPAIYRETFNVFSRGLFGANLVEISALCALLEFGFEFEDFEPERDVDDSDNVPRKRQRTWSYTFRRGMVEFISALARQLGDRVKVNANVTSISKTGEGYRVAWLNPDGLQQSADARAVVLAVPAPIALQLAGENLSPEERRILAGIRYAPYATVAIMTPKPIFDRAFDLAVPDGLVFTDLYDATWVQRHFEPNAGEPGVGILVAYLSASNSTDTSFLAMDDKTILDRTRRDLETIFPDAWTGVEKTIVRRFPHSYPVMPPGSCASLTRLHELQDGSTLQLAGDYMVYPTLDAAAESGELAAQRLRRTLLKRK